MPQGSEVISPVAGTGSGVAAGFLAASPATGPLAPIVAGIGAAVALVGGIFTAHHKQAVKNEAQAIYQGLQQWAADVTAVFNALNSGQINAATAQQALDATVTSRWESVIYDTYHVKREANNGPPVVLQAWLLPAVQAMKQLITAGGGTYTFGGVPDLRGDGVHLNPFTVTYVRSIGGSLTSSVQSFLSGFGELLGISPATTATAPVTMAGVTPLGSPGSQVPVWVWLLGGGALLFALFAAGKGRA